MDNSTDVFLSYNWGNDETHRDNHCRVSRINDGLKKIGYQTWFDEQSLHGDLAQKISQGIEQTKGVIAFITQTYHDKVNSEDFNYCNLEFGYASRKKGKSMIAVVMEERMCDANKWTGLVGLHLGGKKYIDMSGNLKKKHYFFKQLKHLQRELQSMEIQPRRSIFSSFFFFFSVLLSGKDKILASYFILT